MPSSGITARGCSSSFAFFFSWSRFLTSEYLPNLQAFLSSLIRSPVSTQPTSVYFSRVRSMPPPRSCCSHYDIPIPCRRCIRPSYSIIHRFTSSFILVFPMAIFPVYLFRVDEAIPPSSKMFSFNSTCCLVARHAFIFQVYGRNLN